MFFSSGLPQDKSKLLAKHYNQNFLAMSRTAIGQTLMVNKLVDLEWKFGGMGPFRHSLGRFSIWPSCSDCGIESNEASWVHLPPTQACSRQGR